MTCGGDYQRTEPMSDGRKYRIVDAQPGDEVHGVLMTPAKLVVSEYDHGVADYSTAELQSIAARLDKAGYGVTKHKRERVKANRRTKPNCRTINVGHWTPIEGHLKVRVLLTGDPAKVRYEFQRLE
jgi:hypothetical protein